MSIVDIHSHILPNIDDGAKDLETSILLLQKMKEQGITHVVATPHFIAQENSLESFLEDRKSSKNILFDAIKDKDLPKVFLGAEVYYFKGISSSKSIKDLAIEGTNYILIELPDSTLTKSVFDDIKDINQNMGLVPIFAHIERYYGDKGFKLLLKFIEENECYAQVNAQPFLSFSSRRIVKKLINKGYISFVATDTHSPEKRPPVLKDALEKLKEINPEQHSEILHSMNAFCEELNNNEK